MAKTRRLFEIARELGVESKAILDKCRAEGIVIDNHMKAVTAGLEATIREWFTEDEEAGFGGTAVETAEKVDLAKVKKARPRRKKAAEPAPDEPVAQESAPAAPVEPPPAEPSAPAEVPAEPEPAVEVEAQEPAPVPVAKRAKPKPAESEPAPEEPASVGPAGPKLETPGAARLKGPKVVRIEAPEQIRAPRPRRPADQGPAGPGGGGAPTLLPQRGPVRGRGARGVTTEKEEEVGRSPRRKAARRPANAAEAEIWTKGVRREQDLIEREERLSHAVGFLKQRRREMRKRAEGGGAPSPALAPGAQVEISEPIFIKDLSAATGIKGADIIKFLFNKGVMATINHTITSDLAVEIALENDIELVVREAVSAEEEVAQRFARRERTEEARRPPVVAVLGHVDHGKTSLLDKIRSTDVATGEAGGITQHIGAFRATIKGTDGGDKTVVFLDTPGHQAFTNMRSRGAHLADLVVLVVSAADGVMPQTVESISHARAAGVPIVIALNKVDRPDATEANIRKILGQLAEQELNPVEWGGATEVVKVSAMTGQGITELVETLDYQAELLELKADYAGSAVGQVIEAELDPGRGPIARVLVQEGNLRIGDFVVIGRAYGKIRSIMDDRGQQLAEAGPATPVEISGIDNVPDAGDHMYVTDSLRAAEDAAEHRRERERRKELATKAKVTLDNLFEHVQAADLKELRIVLKADVQGSVEVLRKALEDLSTAEVKVRVLHAAVGGITEADVTLAEASGAVVVGFQVIASAVARSEAERRGVDVRNYRVIYDIVDDVRKAMEGMLAPQKREEVLGHAEVRDVFRVSKVGSVAGCYVTDGVVQRNALIRVTRDGIVVEHDRTLHTLKRFKDDAREVRSGTECGMKIDGYDDIHPGDVLECYVTKEFKPTLA